MAGRIYVGTSSWADPGFVADWYPKKMAARDRLPWYAERFEAVELNSSFYAVPEAEMAARWAEVTPDGFLFTVKLHRLLSRHSAEVGSLPPDLRGEADVDGRGRVRLDADLEQALAGAVVDAVAPLQETGKLAGFLLQLSPSFSPKAHELEELRPLVERLAPQVTAIELRNRNWVDGERTGETLEAIADLGAAWVGVDAPQADHFTIMPPVDAVTDDRLAYLRAHGRNADGYLTGPHRGRALRMGVLGR